MKKLITSLVVAALLAVPIGCDSEPESGGTGGAMPSAADGKDAPADVDPETGKARTEAEVMKIQGPGGEADPDAPIKADGGGN
jgi:hypothetical protein